MCSNRRRAKTDFRICGLLYAYMRYVFRLGFITCCTQKCEAYDDHAAVLQVADIGCIGTTILRFSCRDEAARVAARNYIDGRPRFAKPSIDDGK